MKVSHLLTKSWLSFPLERKRGIISPRGFVLGLGSQLLFFITQTNLLWIKPEKGIWLFGAQEKYYFHLSHENDDMKGEIARGWAE